MFKQCTKPVYICSQVLEIKSDFTAARLHRANVYLKLAQYVDAKEDFLQVVSTTSYLLQVTGQMYSNRDIVFCDFILHCYLSQQ